MGLVVEVLYLSSCRSLTGVFSVSTPLRNPWVVSGVTAQLIGQAALTYLPVFNGLFHTTPLDAHSWLRILAVALAAWPS